MPRCSASTAAPGSSPSRSAIGDGNAMPVPNTPPVRLDAASMAWNAVASFSSYDEAQAAVDRLSDDGFPVEHLDIVGSDLRLLERVTGRLTKWRAAAAGGLSGMWAGLLIGILFGLFTTGHAWLAIVAVGTGLGVLWGAIFGFAAHLAT